MAYTQQLADLKKVKGIAPHKQKWAIASVLSCIGQSVRELQELSTQAQTIVSLAISDRTKKLYLFYWKRFSLFCEENKISKKLPVSVAKLLNFLASLLFKGYKLNTVASHASALAYINKAFGYNDFSNYLEIRFRAETTLAKRLRLELIPPLSQDALHKHLNYYDVGLAIEVVNDLNRDLCLTNKLFAYLQSGLFVLASQTRAQRDFLLSFEKCGICTELSKEIFASNLQELWDNRDKIRNGRRDRMAYSEPLSWENNALKILDLWNQTIH